MRTMPRPGRTACSQYLNPCYVSQTEQEEVGRQRLSKEYMKSTGKIRQSMIGLSG